MSNLDLTEAVARDIEAHVPEDELVSRPLWWTDANVHEVEGILRETGRIKG